MFETIVAAIDSDPERSARVVEAAQELAQKFGSEVVVAHVRDVERPQAMVTPSAHRCLVLTKVRYFFHRNEQDRQQDAERKAIRAGAQDGRPGAPGRGLVLPVVAPPLVPMRIVGGWG